MSKPFTNLKAHVFPSEANDKDFHRFGEVS